MGNILYSVTINVCMHVGRLHGSRPDDTKCTLRVRCMPMTIIRQRNGPGGTVGFFF